MALKYLDLRKAQTDDPLTVDELKCIEKIEMFVDGEILKQWASGTVNIDLEIAHFEIEPLTGKYTGHNQFRRNIMHDMLKKCFNAADWICKDVYDDSHSMHSRNVWQLTPKNLK